MYHKKQKSKFVQQNNQSSQKKVGYFLEDTFDQTEQPITLNDSLEFKTQYYNKFATNLCRDSFDSINNSTSYNQNSTSKHQIQISPRLVTASTTQRSFTNNSNLLLSVSNTQTSRLNNTNNSYRLSPQYNFSQKDLRSNKSNNKIVSISMNNHSNNILLDDNFELKNSNTSSKMNKRELLLQVVQNFQNKQDNFKIRSSHLFQQQEDMSNDHIIEVPSRTQFPIMNNLNLSNKLLQESNQKQVTSQSALTQNKVNDSNSILLNSSTKSNTNKQSPILQKLYLSTKNLNNRNLTNSPQQSLPITSRLHQFIDSKVKEKFFKSITSEQNSSHSMNVAVNSQREFIKNIKDEFQNCSIQLITSNLESRRKLDRDSGNFASSFQFLREKNSLLDHVNNQFQYFLGEYKRVSNMYKLSTTYRQGIQNLYQINKQCTTKLLKHINEWQEVKKNKTLQEINKTKNIVETTADNLAIDVFISKNPMQIMCVSLACAKIYISLKKPVKAIPILKQCKRLSDLYRNQKYKMKCYKALSEAFMMIRKENIAEKFIKKYLQLSWCIKSEKNELLAYDLLGLLSYYNGDIERAKFYHYRMANNILEDENSQLKKISLLNQVTKQKRRDEKMKEENPPIGRKVEGDENTFLDSSEEEAEEILLVPEPSQQKQNEWMAKSNLSQKRNNQNIGEYEESENSKDEYNYFQDEDQQQNSISPHLYLSYKQGYQLRKQGINEIQDSFHAQKVINEANKRIRQKKKTYNLMGQEKLSMPINSQKLDLGPLKPPIIVSHLSRNRALQNFQKFELQNKAELIREGDINYWEPFDLKKAESRLLKMLKILKYFNQILLDFSVDMDSNIMLPDEKNKYFSDKSFQIKYYLFKITSQPHIYQHKSNLSIKK